MRNRKGQINIGLILGIVAPFLFASIGFGWNAMTKSDSALKEVSELKGAVIEVRNDVKWIRDILDKQTNKKSAVATSSNIYDGYR